MSDTMAEIRLDLEAYGRLTDKLVDALLKIRLTGSPEVIEIVDCALQDAIALARERTSE